MAELIERPNYYQLQFLGADDFKAEQAYHRDMRRRHNIGPHRWGIVTGLELVERPRDGGGFDVYIEPGMAIDGFGREIFIVAPALSSSGSSIRVHTQYACRPSAQALRMRSTSSGRRSALSATVCTGVRPGGSSSIADTSRSA